MRSGRKMRHGPLKMPEGVQFRLWAPSAQSVDLLLNDGRVPMKPTDNGWYEVTATSAKTGDKYRFRIDDRLDISDPASRFQPEGVNGPSELVDPGSYVWSDAAWRPLPWEEAVIYELHVGTFTSGGRYKDIESKLEYLATLGVTAIELMPIATFSGQRGWGYDGVLPYAPYSVYGSPDDLKHFIDAAHKAGLMVFLDVVYNHFGPSGNFLNEYAEKFFTEKYKTPWGSAINMEGAAEVRSFFIDNALYWLGEFHFDGLRFDAVHAIFDGSEKHILRELSETVRREYPDRHLVLENDKNEARYMERDGAQPKYFTAQWNDDIHHCLHTLLTGEKDGYYSDYADNPTEQLGRCLTQGFAWQGEFSPHRNEKRGEKSDHLPPQGFVSFLQNHDQIGNRAMGERLATLLSKEKLTLAMMILLLAPQPPLLFMGEEWGAQTPFLYFCDFEGELADQVREGRRNEFKNFPAFADPKTRDAIPDPNAESTFLSSVLAWDEMLETNGASRLSFTKHILGLRRRYIVPLVKSGRLRNDYQVKDDKLEVNWTFNAGILHLIANFSDHAIEIRELPDATHIWGHVGDHLPAWKSSWFVENRHG